MFRMIKGSKRGVGGVWHAVVCSRQRGAAGRGGRVLLSALGVQDGKRQQKRCGIHVGSDASFDFPNNHTYVHSGYVDNSRKLLFNA